MPRSTQGQTGSARAVWPFTITEQVGPPDYGYGNLTTSGTIKKLRRLVDDGPQSCGGDPS